MAKPFEKIFEEAGAGVHVHSPQCIKPYNGMYFCDQTKPMEGIPAVEAERILEAASQPKAGVWVLMRPGSDGSPIVSQVFSGGPEGELHALRALSEDLSLPYGLKVLFTEYGREV